MPVIVYIGLGSNMGNRKANCRKAVELLAGAGEVTNVSSLYCTEPVGFAEQAEFLNAVVELRTMLSPLELLDICQQIETEMGRKRDVRWGPRTIDIDILLYGDKVINTENLTIPHSLMHERRFVLVPLAEIAPDAFHPALRKTARQLLDLSNDTHRVILCGRLDDDL